MKIGIQTWGSHGDIRPLLALADGLQSAGHQVTLAIANAQAKSAAFNYPSFSTSGVKIINVTTVVSNNDYEKLFYRAKSSYKQNRILFSMLQKSDKSLFSAAEKLCIENDIIIGAHKLYPTHIAAEKHRKPYINVTFCPYLIPSKSTSPISTIQLGTTMNRILWRLSNQVAAIKFLPAINKLRGEQGLRSAKCLFTDVCHSSVLNLIAASPTLISPQTVWPRNTKISGFLNQGNKAHEGVFTNELRHFLSQGAAPIYIGFGSMSPNIKEMRLLLHNIIITAVKKLNCRVIVQLTSDESLELVSNNQFFYVTKSPHQRVFPKCRMVIHHGGAGTTHTVMTAGVPSIVLSFIDEQRYWGNLLHRLGVSPKVVDIRKLTASKLVKKIRHVFNNSAMGDRAKQIGVKIARENGVTEAVRLIEQSIQDK